MTCNKCNQMIIDTTQLQNYSSKQLIDLYKQGYKLNSTNSINLSNLTNIQELSFSDIGTAQYFFLGIWSYLTYKAYKSHHTLWTILFAALDLGTIGGIYANYKIKDIIPIPRLKT